MKAAFYTLGCKVNQYETEYMSELLKNAGFEIVSHNEKADFYIINSCTVTATADQKTRQSVRKFKRNNPNSVVILTGCMPQAFPEKSELLDEADIILSNRDDSKLLELIGEYEASRNRKVYINPHKSEDRFDEYKINTFNERIRAFVKIEDGCDRFCSYCIIPKARGRVRSKSLELLKEEIDGLANSGIKEIVLVGINLSAYGKGEVYNIADAVELCANNPDILRIRLGSLEPDHITEDIIDRLSKVEKFCPQFHLSLQSGCDRTLKNMNRHYTAAEYKALCNNLRKSFEDCSITTDVMVGFHDESEEDFYASLDFVKSVGFEKVHTFPYSERQGTAASKRGDNVPKAEKERRAAVMIAETDKIRQKHLNGLIGKSVEVLFESSVEKDVYQGYTRSYLPVRIKSESDIIGQIKNVRIISANQEFCIAE